VGLQGSGRQLGEEKVGVMARIVTLLECKTKGLNAKIRKKGYSI